MRIEIESQQDVSIELQPVNETGVTLEQAAPVPIVVKNKTIDIEPQQKPDIGIDIVNKVAFGSGVVIVESENQYMEMWRDNKLDAKKWYILYDDKGDLLKIWMGRKLFARKGEEGEKKTNVFPLVFPIVF